MGKKEEILIRCIEDIKAGKASLEDCLQAYPGMGDELAPLLKITLNIKKPADIKPFDEFRVQARAGLMRHIHESQAQEKRNQKAAPVYDRPSWFTGWTKVAAVTAAVVIFISAAGTGTAFASKSSLPGDTLYPVKLSTEQVQRIFTFDEAAEVELELVFADTRLDELAQVSTMPDEATSITYSVVPMAVSWFPAAETENTFITKAERIELAITGYEKNINLAIEKSANITGNAALLERVALKILEQIEKIDKIEDRASPAALAAITKSKEAAINGQIKSIQNLATVEPEKAKEINEQAIQNRAARAEAVRGQNHKADDALQDMEKLQQSGKDSHDSGGNTSNNESNSQQENNGNKPANSNGKPSSSNNGTALPSGNNQPGNSQPAGSAENASSNSGTSLPDDTPQQTPGKPEDTPGKGNGNNGQQTEPDNEKGR